MSKFRGTCTKEVAIIIGISEKVIPNNRTYFTILFYTIMNCIYLWYKK